MLGDQRTQLADEVGVGAGRELGAHPLLDRLHAQLLEAADLELRELGEAVVGQRRPTPQGERGVEVPGGRLGAVLGDRGPAALEQVLEAVGVDRLVLDAQRVADGTPQDHDGRVGAGRLE